MAEITRPDLSILWAEDGTLNPPSEDKIQTGWVSEIPSFQYENYIQNRQDQALKYLFQHGIAQWNASEEYFLGRSIVWYNSVLYVAIANNINRNPATQTIYWMPLWQSLATQSMPLRNLIRFSTPGTTSWTVPSDVTRVKVYCTGGGGSGGGGNLDPQGRAGGGGAGGTAIGLFNVSPGQVISIVVGAGGQGNTTTGNNGGQSRFGNFCIANGGNRSTGSSAIPYAGGGGGSATDGSGSTTPPPNILTMSGGDGSDGAGKYGPGSPYSQLTTIGGGNGGASYWGGGGRGSEATSSETGRQAEAYGAGGGGVHGAGSPGGNGATGVVVIEY